MADYPWRWRATAECRVEVAAGESAFALDPGLTPTEVIVAGGGTVLAPRRLGVEDGLAHWSLPGLPSGEWRLRLAYEGTGWAPAGDAWSARLTDGIAPMGEQRGCVTLSLRGAPPGVLVLTGGSPEGEVRVLCGREGLILAGNWSVWMDEESGVAMARLGAEPPADSWFVAIAAGQAAAASALGLPLQGPILVAGAGEPAAERGIIVVPDESLSSAPSPPALATLLASQWIPAGRDPSLHPLGRFLLPFVGAPTTPLSRRLSDRSLLARQAVSFSRPSARQFDPLLLATASADAAAAGFRPDCQEPRPWPEVAVADTVVTRLRGGYEAEVTIDFLGSCPTPLVVEVTAGERRARATVTLERGRNAALVRTAWAPTQARLDPDAIFVGLLPRDHQTTLLGDLAPTSFQEWVQPAGMAAAFGPGGTSWPEAGTIRLPDGTEHPWGSQSLLWVSGPGQGWLVRAAGGGPVPAAPAAGATHGWLLTEAGAPTRWGTNAGGAISLPPPANLPVV